MIRPPVPHPDARRSLEHGNLSPRPRAPGLCFLRRSIDQLKTPVGAWVHTPRKAGSTPANLFQPHAQRPRLDQRAHVHFDRSPAVARQPLAGGQAIDLVDLHPAAAAARGQKRFKSAVHEYFQIHTGTPMAAPKKPVDEVKNIPHRLYLSEQEEAIVRKEMANLGFKSFNAYVAYKLGLSQVSRKNVA
jgi:hypothetical protein